MSNADEHSRDGTKKDLKFPSPKYKVRSSNETEGCRNQNCVKCDARVDGRLYVCKNVHVNKNINVSGFVNVGADISFQDCNSLKSRLNDISNDIHYLYRAIAKLNERFDNLNKSPVDYNINVVEATSNENKECDEKIESEVCVENVPVLEHISDSESDSDTDEVVENPFTLVSRQCHKCHGNKCVRNKCQRKNHHNH